VSTVFNPTTEHPQFHHSQTIASAITSQISVHRMSANFCAAGIEPPQVNSPFPPTINALMKVIPVCKPTNVKITTQTKSSLLQIDLIYLHPVLLHHLAMSHVMEVVGMLSLQLSMVLQLLLSLSLHPLVRLRRRSRGRIHTFRLRTCL